MSLFEALTEGFTLAIVFLAVEVLGKSGPVNWAVNPLVGRFPALVGVMSEIQRTPLFLTLLGIAVLMQALQSLSRYASAVSLSDFAARCRAEVTALIHSQILSLSFACASSYRVGDLIDYAANGPVAVQRQIELSGQLLVNGLLVLMYLLILMGLSPWLLLVAIGLALAIVLIQRMLLPLIRSGSRQLTAIQVAIGSRVTEDIQGLRLLHSSGMLDQADQHLRSQMDILESVLRRQGRLMQIIVPVSSFLPMVAIAMIGGLSLLLFGTRSTGVLPSLVAFVVALQRLNVRLSSMASAFTLISDNASAIERLNQILEKKGKVFRRCGGITFVRLQDEIRFENVWLSYIQGQPPALLGIDLSLSKGHTVALVGSSGAGKSSIADLLVGLFAPTVGRVLVDGQDLYSLELSSWQQKLGVVSQDTFLFNTSIAENIAFGCHWATRADIEAAAVTAQAAAFIEDLPDQYDSVIGERGYRLSGGQRQRISLARAILRHPELLILDEATSALDSESERLVQEALRQFQRRCTVLVVAHRLSTVVNADEICVMEGGRIVERGNHVSLLANPGRYALLWQKQSLTENQSFLKMA